MKTIGTLLRALAGLALTVGLAAAQQPQPGQAEPAAGTVKALPVIEEEEEPVKQPAKGGAPVVEEEEPVKPGPKAGAPVVEEEEPVKPAKPGAPVVEEEEPVKQPAKPSTPQVIEEDAPAPAPPVNDDSLLRAPSVIALPRLDLRVFADAGYVHEKAKGERTVSGFNVGAFDLFVSSKLNDKVSVLAEGLFERHAGEYHFDLERAVLRYRHNKYLTFDMGRFHSSISYYNSTYHHGRWFEMAAERPFIAEWEDDKGILPSHGVGLQVSGALPSPEVLPISYFVEITNGRGFTNGVNDVQSGGDTDTNKATNIGLVFRPARIPGLQFGTSVYRDRLRPGNGPDWSEKIFAFHVVYQRKGWQVLNEVVHLRHRSLPGTGLVPEAALRAKELAGTPGTQDNRSSISGMYSQVGYRIGKIVPFTRFDWLNAPGTNPVARAAFGDDTGLRREVAAGFFFDLSSFSALKFQVDRVHKRGIPASEAIAQLAFAF